MQNVGDIDREEKQVCWHSNKGAGEIYVVGSPHIQYKLFVFKYQFAARSVTDLHILYFAPSPRRMEMLKQNLACLVGAARRKSSYEKAERDQREKDARATMRKRDSGIK